MSVEPPQTLRLRRVGVVLVVGLLLPGLAAAQQATSGIAGVARDTSGAVLPGVTVEATSPALIEKVRVAVTDGQGRYNIVSLPPGTYTVTFTLPGFSAFRREGVALTAGFTATVNGDMRVGALEETVTVTGEAPLVDTQNVRQQTTVSSELLSVLPSSKAAVSAVIAMTPGVVAQPDVGGSSGIWVSQATTNISFRGKGGMSLAYDGFDIAAVLGNGNTGYLVNPMMIREMVVEKGGGTAESVSSALMMNAIPKDGGNTFSVDIAANYANNHMASDNLNDELRSRGVTSTDAVRYVYDVGGSVGGPIAVDRLWFFSSAQALGNLNWVANNYFNATQGTPFYTPDFSRPATQEDESWRGAVRTTWQATPRNKTSVAYELQKINEHRRRVSGAPEAAINYRHKSGIIQGAWSSPVSNRLLLEAGVGVMFFNFPTFPQPEVTDPLNTISILEQSTNYRYNAQPAYTKPEHNERWNERVAASYVTGSHAFKVGFQLEQHLRDNCQGCNGPQPHVSYIFNRGVPTSVALNATPYLIQNRTKAELGIFAQDQWTFRRLTATYGLRFDYFNGYIPEQDIAATRFVPARHYDRVDNVPNWTDLSPRAGLAYDLFGNGRTALKFAFGRYLLKETVSLNNSLNPLVTSVNSVNRTWTDADGDFVPDCVLENPAANGECAANNNANFGSPNVTTVYADDILEGFGVRAHNWDVSVEVQHELSRRISVTAGYYRTTFSEPRNGSFNATPDAWSAGRASPLFATDNLLVTPADYDPFCITAPRDARLPGGGGYQVCGLYDINPSKFGQFRGRVEHASVFGDPKATSDAIALTTSTRFASGLLLSGGVDTGRMVDDSCFVVDSPRALLNCRVVTPWGSQTQVKVQGSYPLPADVVVSAVFQNVPGARYEATYNATNAEIAPSLGRNLAACGTRPVCTATVAVPLLGPMNFEDRRTQLDLRLTKRMDLGSGSVRLNLDVYNALNTSALVNVNSTFGPAWRQAQSGGLGATSLGVMQARLFKVSGEWSF